MKILFIGGTNFIGAYAVRQLHALGHDIAVFHRGNAKPDFPAEVQHIHGDRKKLAEHGQALREFQPDVIIDMILMDTASAEALVAEFGSIVGRIVCISSVDVYQVYDILHTKDPGPPMPMPLTEESPLRNKLYPYRGVFDGLEDYDKIPIEKTILANQDCEGVVLRLPMVFGPHDRQRRLFGYLKRMTDNRPFIVLEETMANWIGPRGYVENMAHAVVCCATHADAAGQTYHVSDSLWLTEREWLQSIASITGWQGNIIEVPSKQMPEDLRSKDNFNQHWYLDTSKIQNTLGFEEIVDRVTALERTIEWDLAHPPEEVNPDQFNYEVEDEAVRVSRGELLK